MASSARRLRGATTRRACARIAATWWSTVRTDSTSRSAISAFVMPSRTSSSTATWRAREPRRVGSGGRARAARDADAEGPQALAGERQDRGRLEALERDHGLGARLGVALHLLQRGLVGVAGATPRGGRGAPVAAQARVPPRRAAFERLDLEPRTLAGSAAARRGTAPRPGSPSAAASPPRPRARRRRRPSATPTRRARSPRRRGRSAAARSARAATRPAISLPAARSPRRASSRPSHGAL